MKNSYKLIQVDKNSFYTYLNCTKYKKIPGFWFHEDHFLNEKDELIASMETSSYGAPTVYMLREDLPHIPYSNIETINIISSLFNKK